MKTQVNVLSKRLQEVEDKNNDMALEMAKRNEIQDFMKKAIVELEQELDKLKVASSNQQQSFLQSTLHYQQQQQLMVNQSMSYMNNQSQSYYQPSIHAMGYADQSQLNNSMMNNPPSNQAKQESLDSGHNNYQPSVEQNIFEGFQTLENHVVSQYYQEQEPVVVMAHH